MSKARGNVWKLRDIVNVKDPEFGARADGVTNDAPAVQNAINSLVNGGTVFCSAGLFILAAQLTIPQNIPIKIEGAGIPQQGAGVATGTELRSTLRDGASPAISVAYGAGSDFSSFGMANLYLSGGTYAEVASPGPGQGGAALGNFVGISIKNKYRWTMDRVRVAGFDVDALRLQNTFYGSARDCAFMYSGCGANAIDSPNVTGFYSCNFQYNVFGTKNIREAFNCSWEGNWKSGAYYNIAQMQAKLISPHFESNNASNTALESDIFVDTVNFLNNLNLHDATFNSGSNYSAKPVATHNFYGKCTFLILTGTLSTTLAAPQNYVLFNMQGSSTLIDQTGTTRLQQAGGYSVVALTGQAKCTVPNFFEVGYAGGTLDAFMRSHIRLTTAAPQNLATITPDSFAQELTLIFADANTTVKHLTGNIRLVGGVDFVSTSRDNLVLMFEPNDNKWHEKSRAVI